MTSHESVLTTIRAAAPEYTPADSTRQLFRDKCFVPLIGPFATGKSSIASAAADLSPNFCHVTSFKTRQPRPGEPASGPHFVDPTNLAAVQRLQRDVEAGRLVNIAIHPTTGDVYGTRPEAFNGEYCLLETMPSFVKDFSLCNFRNIVPVTVVTEPEEWFMRISDRYADRRSNRTNELRARLDEGISNLTDSLADPASIWLNNTARTVESAAEELIAITSLDYRPPDANRRIGQALLDAMEDFRGTM